MKIIKQFSDPIYMRKTYESWESDDELVGDWAWGLGADGNLYCKCSDFENDDWYLFSHTSFKVGIPEMKRIVKEFGHLLVFI
jgi:hypothetical protein